MIKESAPQDNNRSFWRPTGASAYAITLVALPGFLLGAFAPEIKEDLSFGDTELGAILTFGYLVSSIIMSVSGGAADQLGPKRVLRSGVTIALIAAFLMGFLGNSFFLLMVFIGLNRVAEGIIHPATNALISSSVILERQGIAMAAKQSAVPFATALAGFAVPTLGIVFGWKGTFLVVALLAFPAWFVIPNAPSINKRNFASRREMWRVSHLQLLALAGAFSAAAVVTVSGFLTTSAKNAGYSDGSAGLILGLGGVLMIISRLTWGYLADRSLFDRFKAVSGSLLIGSLAFVLFAIESKASIAVGSIFIFGIGWSWPGLALLGIIEQHRDEPGEATAIVQTSIRIGAMFAPLGFGLIADSFNYSYAWLCSLVSALLGAFFMFLASSRLPKPKNS
ncbi:MAG: MFS transporter [Actinomycetota bacterium]|nr:MFS transporter [Actinomycetota bacterium]